MRRAMGFPYHEVFKLSVDFHVNFYIYDKFFENMFFQEKPVVFDRENLMITH